MVLEYRVEWSVPGGGAGVSVFHGRGTTGSSAQEAGQELADRARAMFDEIKSYFPSAISFSFPSEVLDRNTSTGVLEALHAITAPGQVVGTATATYARPVGSRIHWSTDAIVAGRRLRGRTFLVPMSSSVFDSNGTLNESFRGGILTAATTFQNSGINAKVEASVWSSTHGIQADITSVSVPDEAAVLRSRRD